jgi:beta-N-acetylhexosaminidase
VPYPSLSSSPLTFGHTGFTGIGVWVDPKYNLLYIFMSNRVNPDGGDNSKLLSMDVRGNIQEAIYKSVMTVEHKVIAKSPIKKNVKPVASRRKRRVRQAL